MPTDESSLAAAREKLAALPPAPEGMEWELGYLWHSDETYYDEILQGKWFPEDESHHEFINWEGPEINRLHQWAGVRSTEYTVFARLRLKAAEVVVIHDPTPPKADLIRRGIRR